MPEWSNGAVSKTVVPLGGTGGSNPSFSATLKAHFVKAKSGFFHSFNR